MGLTGRERARIIDLAKNEVRNLEDVNIPNDPLIEVVQENADEGPAVGYWVQAEIWVSEEDLRNTTADLKTDGVER